MPESKREFVSPPPHRMGVSRQCSRTLHPVIYAGPMGTSTVKRNMNNRSRGQRTVRTMIQKQISVLAVLIAMGGAIQAQVAQIQSYTEAHRAELTDSECRGRSRRA
jgi:hypothetical protein